MNFNLITENYLEEDGIIKEISKVMEEHVLHESRRIAEYEEILICGSEDREIVEQCFIDLKKLGITIYINRRKVKYSFSHVPTTIMATYKDRKTIVEYCLATRYTTRFNKNGGIVFIAPQSVIEFAEYAKNLFLGKEK